MELPIDVALNQEINLISGSGFAEEVTRITKKMLLFNFLVCSVIYFVYSLSDQEVFV